MLWVYINNQGTAECVVNTGNKIRQGDGFEMFIVLWGMNNEQGSDISLTSLQNVKYLASPSQSFVIADFSPTPVSKEFVLNNPVQANNHFIGQHTYNGYLVTIPSDATSFAVNGGNIALEIVCLDENGYAHAQTISVFVEPTYGAKVSRITSDDYNLLIDLIRQANFMLSFAMTPVNGIASIIQGNVSSYPTLFLTKTLGFVHGILSIDRQALLNAYEQAEETDDFQTIAYLDSANVSLKIPSTLFGRDQEGNDIQFRLNNGEGNRINLEVYIHDIDDTSGTMADIDEVSFFGTCWIDAEYLDFKTGVTSGKVISAVTATSVSLPAGSEATVEVEQISSSEDDNSATLAFTFGIPKGDKGDTGSPAGFGSVSASVTSVTPSPVAGEASATASVVTSGPNTAKNMQFRFGFQVPSAVAVDGLGVIAFSVNSEGHLIAHTAQDQATGLSLVDDPQDPLDGHLIFNY